MSSDTGSSPAAEVALPVLMAATVVKGFGRGSKMLGIPTANMSTDELGTVLDNIPTGIWFGWAYLRGEVYKAVSSIGWNPYFNNDKKTVEPHLLHQFPQDFYGEHLRFLMCGFIRPEANFDSLEALVAAIHNDIDQASKKLDEEEFQSYKTSKLDWTTCPPPVHGSQDETPTCNGGAAPSGGSSAA